MYDFWDKLEFKTDAFWYFESFAWVEQMKRVFREIKRKGFDVEKAVKHLNQNANSKSLGKCARYVRLAIEARGMSTVGRPNSACNYDKFLLKKEFGEVHILSLDKYKPQKGDIAVFEAFQGKNKYHEHGTFKCIMEKVGFLILFNQDFGQALITEHISLILKYLDGNENKIYNSTFIFC
ncbi:hypothetical protein CGC48_02240 [Capnocytophaga cynodegmi]|uniref:Uncharacterized protein n=1 Tax=Capnocytophaga cynodegmi TaxID=28189 RepID=A0A286NTV8_9FLAO|nr:hypothetical protein [Capnocytophaga cynodegmi]ATA67551.1 hypothetical protein CGC48_02240 [Capnocytophaga cynodegmi]